MIANNNIMESVIHITKDRDKKSVEIALLEILADFSSIETMVLFNIPRRNVGTFMEVVECIPLTAFQNFTASNRYEVSEDGIKQDESTQLCIKTSEIVSTTHNDQQRLLLPIIINNVVTGILDIHGQDISQDTQDAVNGFIQVFSNFLAIIDDNEHDTLTGLLNRKTFDLRLSELMSLSDEKIDNLNFSQQERRKDKEDTYHWAGILDIDHFKNINDTYGHVYGDEILLLFSNLMENTFRSNDLLFRYGGEEFVVVITPSTEAEAHIAFERFRKALEEYDFPQVGQVTASIGMVKISDQEHATTVLEHADQALYYAKEHGRNQVQNYHMLIQSGEIKELQVVNDVEMF